MDIEELFIKFVNQYDINDENIDLKYHHSFRVMDLCILMAKDLKLDENDIEIAKLIGLLHDYGRFYQLSKFNTFNDFKSIDHGDVGVQMLFDNEEIKQYTSKIKNYDEIYDAIKYHNKYKYPDYLSNHNKLMCNIIRDADKLDILYLVTEDVIKLNETNADISLKVKEQFQLHQSIDMHNAKNSSDKVLVFLGFVYDLNYEYSFKYIIDNCIFDKIYNKLKNKEKYKKYFDEVNNYIGGKYVRKKI